VNKGSPVCPAKKNSPTAPDVKVNASPGLRIEGDIPGLKEMNILDPP
jgi:hypothetical protein